MARLIINPGSPTASEIQLKPGANRLGRSPENDVTIADASVSGSHCQILVTEANVMIQDLGSTNGTFVNRVPVKESVLKAGQTIHLGGVPILFCCDAPISGTSTAPTPPQVRMVVPAPRPPVAVSLPPPPDLTAPPPVPFASAPPVQTAAMPTTGTSSQTCKSHPKTQARFQCNRCQQSFCELCVNTRQEGGVSRKFCRACGVECLTLQPRLPQVVSQKNSFIKQALGAFAYPLKGDGLILLVAGTIFYSLINAAKFLAVFAGLLGLVALLILTVLGTGYLTSYLRRILMSSAMGEEKMPDWPDVSDIASDIVSPFLQLLGTVLACFAPVLAAAYFVESGHEEAGWLLVAAYVFGCLYFPMAFLAVAIFDSVAAVNPMVIIPAILKVPLHYLLTIILLATVLAADWAGKELLPMAIPIRFVSSIISSLVGLYLLTVEMRILGLLYLTNKQKLGWFNR